MKPKSAVHTVQLLKFRVATEDTNAKLKNKHKAEYQMRQQKEEAQ